jgi:hypothetical protein
MKKYKEGVDYKLIDYNNYDSAIQLIGQPYQNVLYSYTGAKLIEEGELVRLQFGYEIIDSAEFHVKALQEDEKFHEIMGNILTEIMTNYDEKTRNNDTEESDYE